MLLNIREGAAKWLVWVIISLVIVTMTLWGISSYFLDGGASSQTLVKVNGKAITADQLTSSFNRLRQQQPQLFSNPNAELQIKADLLTQLTNQSVLSQAATREGFIVNQSQIDGFITSIPAFQIDHQFSNNQFNMVLNRLLYTPAEFISDLNDTLLMNQVRNGIAMSAFALPTETNRFITLTKQQRDIGYATISAQRFLSTIKITPQQINDYYQQNQAQFQNPEQVSIDYVMITPASINASIKPTDAQLMSYYQNNIANYTTPARWHVAHILLTVPSNVTAAQLQAMTKKLAALRTQAQQGKDFAILAKQNSEDVMSASQGGEIPWFTAGSLGGAFEQAVAQLKPGEISQPVKTQYGLEIIKLLQVTPEQIKPYGQVAATIKQAYISQQAQTVLDEKNDDLANLTFENPNSLAPAAKQLGLTIQTTPLFTRQGLANGLPANPAIVSAAFGDDVLAQDNNSEVLTLKDGSLLVLRTHQHIPATVKPLTQVQGIIQQNLLQKQAQLQAVEFGTNLLTQLQNGASLAAIISKNSLQWHVATGITRDAKNLNPEIVAQAFALPKPAANNQPSIQGLTLNNGDYALVAVTNVIDAKSTMASAAQQANFSKQVEDVLGQANYAAYVQTQFDKAKIKKSS